MPRTASWATILEDGSIELELYDHSEDAQKWMGNDVAWMYRVEADEKPRIRELLSARSGFPVVDDDVMLGAFARLFDDTWKVRDWLKEQAVPFTEKFDSWA